MDHKEQVEHFSHELGNLVERFRQEYNLDYSSMIGCLHLQSHFLSQEAYEEADEMPPPNTDSAYEPEGGS